MPTQCVPSGRREKSTVGFDFPGRTADRRAAKKASKVLFINRERSRKGSRKIQLKSFKRSAPRDPKLFVQLVQQQAPARPVWLKPHSIDHHLRNRTLAHPLHYLCRGRRIVVHVNLRVLYPMRIQELLCRPAIPAPTRRINLHLHIHILPAPPC